MHWLWTRSQDRIGTAALLDVDVEEARQTLAQLGTVEALRRQVERLTGQMTRLGRDYARLAGTFAWALDVMRQRGRERDHGPSR